MRLKTMLLIVLLAPRLSFAGGSVPMSHLRPLFAQMPAVQNFIVSTLRLADGAEAQTRFGPHFEHLSGARMGPYTIDAQSLKDGKPLVVVLCTATKFLDKRGREVPDGQIDEAVSIEERLTGVLLRQPGDVGALPPC